MEAAARPPLHLVDTATGEAHEVCPHCAGYERDLKGYRLRLAKMERDLAEQLGDEPQAELVRAILDDWCDIALASGWWGRRPRYKPADARWKATKAALNRDYDVAYLHVVNRGAFMAAARERTNPRFSRAWLQPQTIYGGNVDTHFEFAMDPERQWVKAALEAPAVLRDRWQEVLDLADPCDCGHARLDHQKPALTVDDKLTFGECLVHTCTCEGFAKDWFRCEDVARWIAAEERATMGASNGAAPRERPAPGRREVQSP